ncbi:MAG: endoglucanase [Mycobacteriales bacterium]
MFQPSRLRPSRAALAGAAAVIAALGTVAWAGAARGAPTPLASLGGLYVDPNSAVMRWVAANPNDSRMPMIRDRIASQPQAHWFANVNVATIQQDVASYVAGATDGSSPVLVAYGITNRDCGGASAGGAPNLTTYGTWIGNFARGVGSSPAIIILEPDSLALQTCLSGADVTARDNAIAAAVQSFRTSAPNAKVYLDAGHSAWNGAGDQANRLRAAGVTNAAGIYTNVSNFNPTANETNFAAQVLSAIGNPALRAVIDTSRNGNGTNGQWCDPSGRAIGQGPTRLTPTSVVDAYLWVKPPGEADGCAAAAGTFVPDLAFALASAGNPPPTNPPTTPPTSPPTTRPTTPPTTPPSTQPTTPPTTPPAGGCLVNWHVDSAWNVGFSTTVTITNRGPAISSWTLAFAFGGNQKITNLWNGVLAPQPAAAVSVGNAGFNGSVPTAGTASFGFQASFSGTNNPPTAFTLNGQACGTA